MGSAQEPPERCDPRVVAGRPLTAARSRRVLDHGPELEDVEVPATLAHPQLAEEERPAVGDRVADDDERGDHDERDEPGQPEHHVPDPLQPAVAEAVDLADVEQQRHPLELRHRELAEPLLVEHRKGAHPRPRLVEQRNLGDDRLVHLRLSAEDDHRRPSVTGEVEQRRPVARARGRRRIERGDQLGGPLGHPVELVEEALLIGVAGDQEHALALAPAAHLVGGRSGAHHRPRHDRERTAEDDEAGQRARRRSPAARWRWRRPPRRRP